jgi:hypothetical protein
MIVLPTKPTIAVRVDPKRMVIYSKPKAGKTSALALLENNLILDFENGSDYVTGMKLKVDNLAKLREIGDSILAAGKPYKYITVDTVTAIEEMCNSYAGNLYRDTAMGSKWGRLADGNIDPNANVLKLPNGAGYLYLREAFFKILDYIETLVPDNGSIILLGHLKDKSIETNGKEVASVDLDLTGKIKSLVCAKADAIGLLSRKKNQVILNFKTSDEITCGARPEHLKNQEIILTELIDNKLIGYWDKIYLNRE